MSAIDFADAPQGPHERESGRTHRRSLPFGDRATVLLASVLVNLLSIAAPLTALLVYDRVLVNDAHATLAILVAGAAVAIAVEAVLRLIRAAIISRASAHADFVARNGVVSRLLRRPTLPGRRMPLAELSGTLSAVGVLRELRFARLLALIDLPFGLAFLVLVGVIGGWLVALPAGVCLVFLAVLGFVALANERASRQLKRVDRDRAGFAEYAGRAMHGIVALGAQVPVIDRFVQHQLGRSGVQGRQGFVDLLSRDVTMTFSQILIGAVIVAGTLTVLEGGLSLGGLAACTLLAGRSLEPLQSCFQLISLRRRARVAREILGPVAAPVPAQARAARCADWSDPPEIRFDGAEITASGGFAPLLAAKDINIQGGEVAAISGDRGAGKTTLGLALLGMATVEGGLHVGGIDAAGPDAAEIRRQTGYLPRCAQLPAGRILDILTDGSETLYADVRYLAHLVGLDDAVKRLPAGYDTVLRPTGVGELSAGVRQQIAICRTLAKKRKLIIADDATAALDAAAEIRFSNVVKMLAGEATVILLTDRPSLKAISSRRFDLSGGRLTPLPSVIGTRP